MQPGALWRAPQFDAPPAVQERKPAEAPAPVAKAEPESEDKPEAEPELAQAPSAPDWSLADPDEPRQAPTDKAG